MPRDGALPRLNLTRNRLRLGRGDLIKYRDVAVLRLYITKG
ncbi:MAG: hypothetical protein ACI85O_002771, partial [Saprospiraceae bacterium]